MSNQSELHNRLAGPIVDSIVRPVLESGGDQQDIFVLLESVVVGVMISLARPGGDSTVVAIFSENLRRRLADARLAEATPEGEA